MTPRRASQGRLLKRLRRILPESVRAPLRAVRSLAFNSNVSALVRIAQTFGARHPPTYDDRLVEETYTFDDQDEIHDLPEIYHYWSNKYLRPELEQYGYSGPTDFFFKELMITTSRKAGPYQFLSIGSGNCDLELAVADRLLAADRRDFTFTCVDINAAMLKRGETAATRLNLQDHVIFQRTDINAWVPSQKYDAVIANQSLHHVVNLEHLLDNAKAAIGDDGTFLVSDIIGRNGHMRWPEALRIVQEFWRELPRRKRFNLQLERYEKKFLDWDCSKEAFEGIRAQDILPLLVERFYFDFFFAYANVIDPFIDRSFGFHFDPSKVEDREFIDRIHARDDAELLAGNIKPTHMVAKMTNRPPAAARHRPRLSAQACIRAQRSS